MPEQSEKGKTTKRSGSALLITQGVICTLVLLVALIARLIGGTFYNELNTWFEDALMDSRFSQTIAERLSDTSAT